MPRANSASTAPPPDNGRCGPESWRSFLCGFPIECPGVLVTDKARHLVCATQTVTLVELVTPAQNDGPDLADIVEVMA